MTDTRTEVSGSLGITAEAPLSIRVETSGLLAITLTGTGWTGTATLVAKRHGATSYVPVSDGVGLVSSTVNSHRLVPVLAGFEYTVSFVRTGGTLGYTLTLDDGTP